MLDTESTAITVLMSAYNAASFIGEAVESVLRQTFTDFEFLIIDDGSSDDTRAIIRTFRDPRIRLVCNAENRGLIASLNWGLELANGRYIARMDADDICRVDRLELQYRYMEKNSDCAVCGSRAEMIDRNGNRLGICEHDFDAADNERIRRYLLVDCCLFHSSVMMRAEVVRAYGYRKEQVGCEDYDLWLRMADDGRRIERLPQVLLAYRLHPDQVTSANAKESVPARRIRMLSEYLRSRPKSRWLSSYNRLVLKRIVELFFLLYKLKVKKWFWSRFDPFLAVIGIRHGKKLLGQYRRMSGRLPRVFCFLDEESESKARLFDSLLNAAGNPPALLWKPGKSYGRKLRPFGSEKLFVVKNRYVRSKSVRPYFSAIISTLLTSKDMGLLVGFSSRAFYDVISRINPCVPILEVFTGCNGDLETRRSSVLSRIGVTLVIDSECVPALKHAGEAQTRNGVGPPLIQWEGHIPDGQNLDGPFDWGKIFKKAGLELEGKVVK